MSAAEMTQAAISLRDRLGDEQDAVVSLPFPHDEERRLCFYTPTDHGGLRLGEMSPVAQQACMRLLAAGLSESGYLTAVWVMALENILDQLEGWPSRGDRRPRDPLGYSVSIFGEPGSDAWGWRFGGHHLSVNVTIVNGEVAATPCFFGADPASSPGPGGAPFRPLGSAEDHGRALVTMLSPAQREVAVLAPVPPHDIVMGNRPTVAQDALPLNLWETFRGRSPLPVDEMRVRQDAEATKLGLRDEHLEAVRITEEPRGLCCRDPDGDFGADLLGRHYSDHHDIH